MSDDVQPVFVPSRQQIRSELTLIMAQLLMLADQCRHAPGAASAGYWVELAQYNASKAWQILGGSHDG